MAPPVELDFLRPSWLRSRLRGPSWLLKHTRQEDMVDVGMHDPGIEASDRIQHTLKQLGFLHQGMSIAWLYLHLQLLGVVRARFMEMWQLADRPQASREELYTVYSHALGLVPRTRDGEHDLRNMSVGEIQKSLALLYFVPQPSKIAVISRNMGHGQLPTYCNRVTDPTTSMVLGLYALLGVEGTTGISGYAPTKWLYGFLMHGSLAPTVEHYKLDGPVKDMLPPFRLPILEASSARVDLEDKEAWPLLQGFVSIELNKKEAEQLGLSEGENPLPDVAEMACMRALGKLYHKVCKRLGVTRSSAVAYDGDIYTQEKYRTFKELGLLEDEKTLMQARLLGL